MYMKTNKAGKPSLEKIAKEFNAETIRIDEPLAPYTTLKIGGPADLLILASSPEDIVTTARIARKRNLPITILGEGSNVLISDNGIRGITIINRRGSMTIQGYAEERTIRDDTIEARWQSDRTRGTFKYDFADLDYDESEKPVVNVTIDSGYSLPSATQALFGEGLTGLQWFSGIPGTIGGAIFNNIHGGTHFFSEYLDEIHVLTRDGRKKSYKAGALGTGYNSTRLQSSGEYVLSATLRLYKGDVDRARATASEWARRKSIQPRNSPGCAFANITEEEKEKHGFPTTATGYIVEHILKMTGYRVGDAAISEKHHNFITNEGNSSSADYLSVMKEIQGRIRDELGIFIKPEIFLLGFNEEELEGLEL
jgi:UDP-N-acetylmuramate dehydrogenase